MRCWTWVAHSRDVVTLAMPSWMGGALGLEGEQAVVEARERCKERSMEDAPRKHSPLGVGGRERAHLGANSSSQRVRKK